MAGNKELEEIFKLGPYGITCHTMSVSHTFRLEPAEGAEKIMIRAGNG